MPLDGPGSDHSNSDRAGLGGAESDKPALAPPAAEQLDPLVGDVRSAATVLAGLDVVDVAEHVARFQHIHQKLQAALTEIDDT